MQIQPAVLSSLVQNISIYPAAKLGISGLTSSSTTYDLPDVTDTNYVTVLTDSYKIDDIGIIEVFDIDFVSYLSLKGNGKYKWSISGDGGSNYKQIIEESFNNAGYTTTSRSGTGKWISLVDTGPDKLVIKLEIKAISGNAQSRIDSYTSLNFTYRRIVSTVYNFVNTGRITEYALAIRFLIHLGLNSGMAMSGGDYYLFKTTDFGNTWTDISTNWYAQSGAFSTGALYLENGIVLVDDDANGLTRSADYGINWTPTIYFSSIRDYTYLGNGECILVGYGVGEDGLRSAVIDTTNQFAYFGTGTSPGKVIKINLSNFTKSNTIIMNSSNKENYLYSAVIDVTNQFAYFATGNPSHPGRVIQIKLSDFTKNVVANSSNNFMYSGVIDIGNQFAYFGLFTTPGGIEKIHLSPFQQSAILIGNAGEVGWISAVIDTTNQFAYFGTWDAISQQGKVIKINLATFTEVATLNLGANEYLLSSAIIDVTNQFAYFGTGTAKIIKINLATFTEVGTISLTSGEDNLTCAIIDVTNQFAYFGSSSYPIPKIIKIDLTTFTNVGTLTLSSGDYSLDSAVIDITNQFAYFGTGTSPGKVIKIDLTTFTKVSSITLLDGTTIYRSTDYGVTFDSGTMISLPIFYLVSLGNNIVLGGGANGHIYRSTDNGVNWTDLGIIGTGDMRISYLQVGVIGLVIVGDSNGHIFKSLDSGLNFTDLGQISSSSILTTTILTNTGNTSYGIIYAGDSNGHIFKSVDTGLNWTDLGTISSFNINKITYLGESNTDIKITLAADGAGYIYKQVDRK